MLDNLPPTHKETLRAMHTVAIALPQISRSESIALYTRLLDSYERFHSDQPLAILNLKRNLALTYRDNRQYSRALELFTQVLEGYRSRLSESDRLVLRSMTDLVSCRLDVKDYEEARELGIEALALCRRHLKRSAPSLRSAIWLLSRAYYGLNEHAERVRLLEEYVQLLQEQEGPQHHSTTSAMETLADAYKDQGDLEREISIREAVVEGDIQSPDADVFSWITTMSLADAYDRLENAERAEAFYGRMLNDRRSAWGIGDPRTVQIAADMIVVFFFHRDHFETVVRLYEQLLLEQQGEQIVFDRNTGLLLVHWADSYWALGYQQAAYELLKQLMVWEAENKEELPLHSLLNKVLPAVCTEEEASDLIWARKKVLIAARGRRRQVESSLYRKPPCPTPDQLGLKPVWERVQPQPEDFLAMPIEQITQILRQNLPQKQYPKQTQELSPLPAETPPKPISLAEIQDLIRRRQELEHEQ